MKKREREGENKQVLQKVHVNHFARNHKLVISTPELRPMSSGHSSWLGSTGRAEMKNCLGRSP